MTIPTYDYDQRNWKKIYGPEELSKIGELITGVPADEIIPVDNRPVVRIKRSAFLKGASVLQNQKDDRADKVLRLLTGNI